VRNTNQIKTDKTLLIANKFKFKTNKFRFTNYRMLKNVLEKNNVSKFIKIKK